MSAEIKKLIGERIRRAREVQGISQSELAERLDKTQNTISGYENGARTPRTEELPQVAEALNRPIAYFFGNDYADEEIMGYVQQLTPPFRTGVIITLRQTVELQNKIMAIYQLERPDADIDEINERAKRFVEANAQEMSDEIQINFENEMNERLFRPKTEDSDSEK